MTDLDLDALEAVARASTHQESWKVTVAEMNDEDGLFPLWGIEDATHIAAFDPPTVIALIERLERAEAREACLRKGRTHRDIRPGLPRRQAPSLYANGLE